MQESGIFKAVIKLPITERAAYLDRECGSNIALRHELEELLVAHDHAGEFMQRPPIADRTTTFGPGPERPGMRIGPYKLLQFLGEGGMGTVFLAEMTEPVRRMVALKIIKPGMDSSQVLARFEAERQALAIMDHPNIARVFDAGTVGSGQLSVDSKDHGPGSPLTTDNSQLTTAGRPYFAMELIKGVPITEFCDKNKLTTRQRLELFIPVCNAIQHAHMKGIIHRDIKPSNVMIALYDGKPVPKVIDFGVAKAMAEPLTQRTLFTTIGQIVGTFEYMSPEQATLNQLDIDTRSDIYSLGVLLYELLTGLTPIDKDRLRSLALDQMLHAIREEEPQRPSARLTSTVGALANAAMYRGVPSQKLADLLRGEIDWIVMRCLEKDRDRRFLTATSLAQDIERYLKDEPVSACPPTLAYRLKKVYRKNRAAVRVASAFVCLMVGAVVMGAVLAVRATNAERDAANDRDTAVASAALAEKERERANQKATALEAEQERTDGLFYVSQMNQAQVAAGEFRTPRLLELLADTTPKPGKRNLRGWEWHYLNRQHHGWESATHFAGQSGRSVGSREEVITTRDGARVVFSPHRTQGISGKLPGGGGPGKRSGTDPGPDVWNMVPQRLLPARAFDTTTGKVVLSRAVGESARGFRLSPCGRFLAYLDPDNGPPDLMPAMNRVRLVELATGQDIPVPLPSVPLGAQIWPGEDARLLTVVTNPVGPTFPDPVSGAFPKETSKVLLVWERGKEQPHRREIPTGLDRPSATLDYVSADGTTAVLVHSPGHEGWRVPDPYLGRVLEFWDVAADPPKLLKTHRHAADVRVLRVSGSGAVLAVAVCNRLTLQDKPVVCLYDTRTGEPRGRWEMPPGIITGTVSTAMAVSDDARRVVVSEPPGMLIVGERADGEPMSEPGRWRAHVRRVPYSKDGLGGQNFVNLWLSPDGSRLASIAADNGPGKSEWARHTWDLTRNPEYDGTWPDELTVEGERCSPNLDPVSRHVTYPLAYALRFRTGKLGPAAGGFTEPEKPAGKWPVEVYNPRLGRVVHRFEGDDRLTGARLSPDGTRVLLTGVPPNEFAIPNAPPHLISSWVCLLRTVGRPGGDQELLRIERSLQKGKGHIPRSPRSPLPYMTDDGRWVIETVTRPTDSGAPEFGLTIASEYKVWKAADGKLSCTIPAGRSESSPMHVPGPDGGHFVTVTGRFLGWTPEGRDNPVRSVICYDPVNGTKRWEWELPERIMRDSQSPTFRSTLMGPEVHSSADGRQLAVSTIRTGQGGAVTVHLLDTASGSVIREFRAGRESPGLRSVNGPQMWWSTFGHNGSFALGMDGEVIVWDGRNPEPVHRLTGHTARCAVFSGDGRRLFTYDAGSAGNRRDGLSIRVWDLTTGREALAIRLPTTNVPSPSKTGPEATEMWLEGERLMLWWGDGIRVFDGTPRSQAKQP